MTELIQGALFHYANCRLEVGLDDFIDQFKFNVLLRFLGGNRGIAILNRNITKC